MTDPRHKYFPDFRLGKRKGSTSEGAAMDEDVERFLDECRADPHFRAHPKDLDLIEEGFTNFYLAADESPAHQHYWDRLRAAVTQKDKTLTERCVVVSLLLREIRDRMDQ